MKISLPVYKFSDITTNNIEKYSKDLEEIKHNSIINYSNLLEIFEYISKYIYERKDYDDGTVSVKFQISKVNIKTLDDIVVKEDFFTNKEELQKFIDKHFKKENCVTLKVYRFFENYDFSNSGIIPEKSEYIEFIQNDEVKMTFEIEYIRCKEDHIYSCINYSIIRLNLYIL